jgi:hypothetical protein
MKYLSHYDKDGKSINHYRINPIDHRKLNERECLLDIFRYDILHKLKIGDSIKLEEF